MATVAGGRRVLSYSLHGLGLGVTAAAPVAAALASRLEGLPATNGAAPHDFSFEVRAAKSERAHALPRPRRGRPVYDPPLGEVLYDPGEDLLYLEHGPRLKALCRPGRGQVVVSAFRPRAEEVWLLSHPLFTLPLTELAKRRGLFPLHAAGVARGGRALVLPGASGAGKSTLALALVRAGLDFLGDDTLFLARRPGGLRLLAFPDEVDVTAETLALLPELGHVAARPLPRGARKRRLRAEETYRARVAWDCAPAALVFPRVGGGAESRLLAVGAGEALLELVPNVLLTHAPSSQAHLDFLAQLAAASRCYRLETGRDLAAAARLLLGLLE